MARPWIEFVQAQNLPWHDSDIEGVRPGVSVRALSADADDGAASLLIRYPAGWQSQGGALAVDEEFLVLSGALQIGDRVYGERAFAHLPAGYARQPLSSKDGAVVLTFFSARPAFAKDGIAPDPARLVEYLDAFTVPYTGKFHPEFPPGAGRKMLYEDPVTHDQSWILGTLPMRWAERAEVHPVIEEMYLLSGESHGNRGVMRPGAYFWRPPGIPHGPYGTLTGNLYFFRTKGGPLQTEYVDVAKPFGWWPAYDPALPAELAGARGEGPSAPACW